MARLSELPRRRRAMVIASVGGIFLILAIVNASWIGFLGAAIVVVAAAAVAAGVKGF